MKTKRKTLTRIALVALVLISLGLIAFGAYGLWNYYKATHNSEPQISADPVTFSTDKPDETALDEVCNQYKVAGNRPRYIEISSISISGCIEPVGIDQNNAIAVPTNINLAGWYTNSVLPGQPGVSIIDGHVMGRYKTAIFTGLDKIKPGDTIIIELGDGTKLKFKTESVDSYRLDSAINELLEPTDGIDKQLNLITCGGRYDSASHSYEERVIVRASLID